MSSEISVLVLGATGAVGNHVALTLAQEPFVSKLTLLGRRQATNVVGDKVSQFQIDIFDPSTYQTNLKGHEVAVCTLGVGQPSKMSRSDFVAIDHDAVMDFAKLCKREGIEHFELLSSVAASSTSHSFYLRTKGLLEDALKSLQFTRLSLFHPSMILTPTNRYGFSQAIFLAVTPVINPLLLGPLRKYRGIPVQVLGQAIAKNVLCEGDDVEVLHWDEVHSIVSSSES